MRRLAVALGVALAIAAAGCDGGDDDGGSGDSRDAGAPGVEAPAPGGSRDLARRAADAACRDTGEFPERRGEPEALRAYYGTAAQVARDRAARLRATGERSLLAFAGQFEQLAGLYDTTRTQAQAGGVDVLRLDAPVQSAERGIDEQARVLRVPACAVSARRP